MTWFTDPFQYGFMQNALLASVLVAVTCGLLGVYVVHRRLAFVGDAVAHATLPGVAIAYLAVVSLPLGAAVAAVATAVLIGWAGRKKAVHDDTAIGIVFTGMFALGVLILTAVRVQKDLTHILIGSVLGVTDEDLGLIVGVFVAVVVIMTALHKELELTSFDPTHAAVIGVNPERLRLVLLVLLALAVVAGTRTVGVVLTSSLLVTPAATASLVTRRLVPGMLLSATLAAGSAFIGLVVSYRAGASAGAAIVLVNTTAFVAVSAVRVLVGR